MIDGVRSFAHAKLAQWEEALADATKCVEMAASFAKGYLRKGQAEMGLGRLEDAMSTFEKGLKADPENAQLKQAMQQAQVKHQNAAMGNMFSPLKFAEIASKPPVSQYMADPDFKQKWDMLQLNPQALITQFMQTDPRFMEVFGLLTGIDMAKLNQAGFEMQKKDEERKEEERRQREKEWKRK